MEDKSHHDLDSDCDTDFYLEVKSEVKHEAVDVPEHVQDTIEENYSEIKEIQWTCVKTKEESENSAVSDTVNHDCTLDTITEDLNTDVLCDIGDNLGSDSCINMSKNSFMISSAKTMKPKRARKCMSLDMETKLKMLREVDQKLMPKKAIARKYVIPPSTLSTIIKNREQLEKIRDSSCMDLGRKRMRLSRLPVIDKALLVWLKNAKATHTPVSNPDLAEKAEELAKEMGLEFQAGPGWLHRFKRRHANVFRADSDANVSRTDSNADVSRTDSDANVPTIDSEANVSRTDSDADVSRADSDANIPTINSEANVPRTDSDADVSRTESDTNVIKMDSDTNVFRACFDDPDSDVRKSSVQDTLESSKKSEPVELVEEDRNPAAPTTVREAREALHILKKYVREQSVAGLLDDIKELEVKLEPYFKQKVKQKVITDFFKRQKLT